MNLVDAFSGKKLILTKPVIRPVFRNPITYKGTIYLLKKHKGTLSLQKEEIIILRNTIFLLKYANILFNVPFIVYLFMNFCLVHALYSAVPIKHV